MKVIDLTHTFDDQMPVYPGDPVSQLLPIASIAREGYTDHELRTGMHVGTHMDAPLHMIEHGKYLSEIPVETFIGRGKVIDCRGHDLLSETLLDGISLDGVSILLFLTGHSQHFRKPEYYASFPVFSEGIAKKMVGMGINIVGMDTPSPDVPPFPIHKILLGNEILIIENLTNVESLLTIPQFNVVALPPKLHADAAPVRVVAIVE